MREAVILAGGVATPLGVFSAQVPAAMLEVDGRPFIDQVAWNLRRHGIEHIVVVAGLFGERLAAHVGDGSAWGVRAEVIVQSDPSGSGGAAALGAANISADEFLLVLGDVIFDINYLDLALRRRTAGAQVAVALRAVDPDATGTVRVDDDGHVVAISQDGVAGAWLSQGGVYAFARSAFDNLSAEPFSLEEDLLPALGDRGEALGVVYAGEFIDLGATEIIADADVQIAAWRDKPMVLLDRDGVLNQDHGWVHTPEEFAWMPGAVQGVKLLNDHGCLTVVVTNQSGIARGLYSEDEYMAFEHWIGEQLAAQGAHLDAVYHCPHHPTEGTTELTRECDCRKPAAGLVRAALADFRVRPERAVFVGDKESDMAAAAAAGIRGARYEGQDLSALLRTIGVFG